jgi:hypothetical protein
VSRYSRTHLPDSALVRTLKSHLATERTSTAELLADLAEVDERRLYAPAGYESMFAWCEGELHLSEDAAYKRLRAARTARDYPAILEMIADGRLHLAAVLLVAPHLTGENAPDLLAAATHRSKRAIEQLLAERFPQPDLVSAVEPLAAAAQLAPGPVRELSTRCGAENSEPAACASALPLAPQRFGIQLTVEQETYDLLCHVQSLLGNHAPTAELPRVFQLALTALASQLERRKLATSGSGRRRIARAVKHAVWTRDGAQCTYVSGVPAAGGSGHRCAARAHLELDHIEPVARGGTSTVDNLRLRCRAHNQLAADAALGAGFIHAKRNPAGHAAHASQGDAEAEARERIIAGRAEQAASARRDELERVRAEEFAQAAEAARAAAEEMRRREAAEKEVVFCLDQLGVKGAVARRVVAECGADPAAAIEVRLKMALGYYARLRCPGAKAAPAA